MNEELRGHAADELENLSILVKESVKRIRDARTSDKLAYALVYDLRRELGYIVRLLGEGLPDKLHLSRAQGIFQDQLGPSKDARAVTRETLNQILNTRE